VLTPTRELAMQIMDQFRALSAGMTLKELVIIGGEDQLVQAKHLCKRPHVVVATPGRLQVRSLSPNPDARAAHTQRDYDSQRQVRLQQIATLSWAYAAGTPPFYRGVRRSLAGNRRRRNSQQSLPVVPEREMCSGQCWDEPIGISRAAAPITRRVGLSPSPRAVGLNSNPPRHSTAAAAL
jgi:hypothetical protein